MAAERLEVFQLLFPNAALSPVIPAIHNQEAKDTESAVREIIRSRLEGLGPVTRQQLSESLAIDSALVEHALIALQQEGFVIQGQFNQKGNATEWCERGLLARIHRYTLKQLRSEIEPVAPVDLMRFLFLCRGWMNPVKAKPPC